MTVTIEKITIDDDTFVVAELSEQVQQAVRKYEDWRERLAIADDEVQLITCAVRDLGAQIVTVVRTEEAQKSADLQNAINDAAADADAEQEVEANVSEEVPVEQEVEANVPEVSNDETVLDVDSTPETLVVEDDETV